ncbi:MAG: ACP S-malonyltransferase [bacterium]
MAKLGILFPGQGAQYPGMGCGWAHVHDTAARRLDEASALLGYDLALILACEDGRLDDTLFAQPATVVSSLLAFETLIQETHLQPAAFAGFSLGEYTALAASGVIAIADVITLVNTRAHAMQEAAREKPGAMCAVIGLSPEAVDTVCHQACGEGGFVTAANFNCPGQIVLSGDAKAIGRAIELSREAGAKRCVLLNVSGAFHSPLMQKAADRMIAALKPILVKTASASVYSNVTALPYGASDWKILLPKQMVSPVLFERTIRNMMENGITHFLEIGPGTVLSGFVRKISFDHPIVSLDRPEQLEQVKGWLHEYGFYE